MNPPDSDSPDSPGPGGGWKGAVLLGLLFTALYLAATQRNPTFDGAAFLAFFRDSPRPSLPHHPLFGYLLWCFIQAGRLAGIGLIPSGQAMAALFGGLSVGSFHLLLRRHEVSPGVAVLFAALLGLSMTVLENATTVELYTPSLFAVLLTMHALRSVTLRPSWRSIGALLLASAVLVGFHTGFGLWVFAVHAALAAREPRWRDGAVWFLRGALVLAFLVLWLFLEGLLTEEEWEKQQAFFTEYGEVAGGIGTVGAFFRSPLSHVARHAGLVIFPAALGAALFRRRRPVESLAAAIGVAAFWLVFTFWEEDFGAFWLPLLPVLGLASAMALDESARRFGARGRALMISALWLHAYLFVFLANLPEAAAQESAMLTVLSGAFWATLYLQCRYSSRLWDAPAAGADSRSGRWLALAGASAVLLSLLAFAPRILQMRQPDDVTLLLESFKSIAPPGARLVTHIDPHRPAVQTGHETLSATKGWQNWMAMARNRKMLTDWIRESADDSGRPLYLDFRICENRSFVFGDETTGNRTEIALSRLNLRPVKAPGQVFCLVEFKDPRDGEIVGRGLDMFDPELWDGIPVRWTRKGALVNFQPTGRWMRLKYWVGHSSISDANPVEVRILVGGVVRAEARFTAKDARTETIDLGEGAAGPHEMLVEVSRTWTAPDGRELGVGLYPLEFSDTPE